MRRALLPLIALSLMACVGSAAIAAPMDAIASHAAEL